MMNDRREFLRWLGSGGVAGLLLRGNLPGGEEPGEVPQEKESRDAEGLTLDELAAFEELFGLTFSEEERATLLSEVKRKSAMWRRGPDLRPEVSPSFGDPSSAAAPRPVVPWISSPQNRAREESDTDIAFAPAWRLGQLIREKKISSMELTKLYLARLRKFDEPLKFVINLCEERALAQAKRLDEEAAKGRFRSALHGVPWGAKDLFAAKGTPTTWGAKPFEKQVIDVDAGVVRRLDDAGCVLLAKLSLGALAMGDVWFKGMTRSPWDPKRGSSGSSAGSASAVAAGCVGFALGTETLGSIVSPSLRCGVTGFRPGFGRVTRHGAMPLVWSMDKVGPLARTAEDCALVYALIAGPDGQDEHLVDRDPLEGVPKTIADMRIGFIKSVGKGREGSLEAAFHAELTAMGIKARPIEMPQAPRSLMQILDAEAACAFDEITRDGRVRQLVSQGRGSWPRSFRAARFIPAVEYLNACRERSLLRMKMEAAMADVDVLIAPPYRGGALFTTNFTGHPSICLPIGMQAKNRPAAMTLIGKLWGERDLLSFATAVQSATRHHLARPPLTS